MVHADLCRATHALILWTGPPLMVWTMSYLVGTGAIPPQLVPERLVSFEQRHLKLLRAVQLAPDHKRQGSDQFNWEPSC